MARVAIQSEFAQALARRATELGITLSKTPAEVADFAVKRAAHLAEQVGKAGYSIAEAHETNAVLLEAGLSAVRDGESADAQIRGFVVDVFRILAAAAA